MATTVAAVRDDHGQVLLVRRHDSGNWELPGGRVELGETATTTAEREVAEESGVIITVTRLASIYTDPGYVMVYPRAGEARQQFAVCFHALPVDGQPHPDDDETCEAASIEPDGILGMGGRDLSDVGDQPGAFVQDARNYLGRGGEPGRDRGRVGPEGGEPPPG